VRTKPLALLVWFLVCLPLPLKALEVEFLWHQSPEVFEITLKWTEPAQAKVAYNPDLGELLVTFDQKVEMPGLEAAEPVMAGWIKGVNLSYDSLFFELSTEMKIETHSEDRSLRLRLVNPYAKRVPVDENTLLFKLVQSRLWIRQGKADQAMDTLNGLALSNRGNTSVLTSMAEAELSLGNWAKALDLANQALVLSPENEGLQDLRRQILREKGTEVWAGKKRRWTDPVSYEWISHQGANLRFFQYLSLGVLAEQDQYDLRELRPIAPQVPAQAKGQIKRTEVSFSLDLPFNVSLKAKSLAQEKIKGRSLEAAAFDIWGETRILRDQDRPYWGITEGLLGASTLSQTRLERVLRVGPKLEAKLALSSRDYLLIGENKAHTQALDGYLQYNWRNPKWLVEKTGKACLTQLELDFAKEKADTTQVRLDSLATGFDQDSYMIRGLASINWDEHFTSQGYLGYGINRLGQNSPLVGIDLFHRSLKALEIHFFASRFIDRRTTNEVGLEARWKF